MSKCILGFWMLIWGAGIARGFTTDDYYSVQSGYWDQSSTWTSTAPAAYGYPRAFDQAYVRHSVWITTDVGCADAYVNGTLDVQSPGQVDIYRQAVISHSRVQGSGPLKTWGTTLFTGVTSRIDVPWYNAGSVEFADAPSLQLENDFLNLNGATVHVETAAFHLFGTSGVGRVRNQGHFWIGHYGTATVDRFQNEAGSIYVGTASLFRVKGRYETNYNGVWQMATGAVYDPLFHGTAYYDGTVVSEGPGRWQMQTGALRCSHYSVTTSFDVAGGFVWQGGTIDVSPTGQLENRGEIEVAANAWTQTLYGLLLNKGKLRLATTSGPGYVELAGAWQNAPGGTTTVESSDFHWRGTGTFENAGTFRVADGVTGSTETVPFSLKDGIVWLGPGAGYGIVGQRQRHAGGLFELGTGSVCRVGCGGTDYWDGAYAATGAGALQMDDGRMNVSFYSATTTVFDVGGDGFRVAGGTLNVLPGQALENRGTMSFVATGTPATLWGELRNRGHVYFGTSTPCRLSAPGGKITNAETGVWDFVQAGGGIEVLTDHFYNYGTVNYQAATTSIAAPFFNMPGATATLQRGTADFLAGLVVYGGWIVLDGGNLGPPGGGVYMENMGGIGALSGTGHVANTVSHNYGTLAPGHSPGALSIGGAYNQGSNAVLQIEIGGKNPGAEYDQLVVASNASVKGTLTVELYDGYVPPSGRRFDVLTAAACSNAFRTTNLPALPPGTDWLLLYRTNGVQLRVASPTDVDGDGLQDDWETTHFGDTTSRDGSDEDFDGDGYADYVEQCLDTQPTNNADFLQVADIATSGSNSLVELRTGSLAQYAIEARPDLSDPVGPWTVVDEFAGTGGTIVRTNAASGALRFYRLKATAP